MLEGREMITLHHPCMFMRMRASGYRWWPTMHCFLITGLHCVPSLLASYHIDTYRDAPSGCLNMISEARPSLFSFCRGVPYYPYIKKAIPWSVHAYACEPSCRRRTSENWKRTLSRHVSVREQTILWWKTNEWNRVVIILRCKGGLEPVRLMKKLCQVQVYKKND